MSNTTAELEDKSIQPEPEAESGKMSFLEHLDELRKRLVHVVIYLTVGFFACVAFCKPIYNFLAKPFTQFLPPGEKLTYISITAPFTVYMKVAFLGAIFLTIPLTLYEVWKFIAPGLYRKEKKYVVPFLVCSIILFVLGAAFCYYIILPTAFQFFINLGSSFKPMVTINEYLDFTNMMLLAFGLMFEMPIVAAFLSLFGLVSAGFLLRKFKYAFVGIVILAAVLSPTGDALNLLMWSAPMVLLYIISIGVVAIIGWRKKAKRLT
jgi:sec-independent protein translocase protein TatC